VKNKIRKRWDEHVARKEREEGCRQGDRWIAGRRWEVNIKIKNNETGLEDVDWIKLAWGRNKGLGCSEFGSDLLDSIKCMKFLD